MLAWVQEDGDRETSQAQFRLEIRVEGLRNESGVVKRMRVVGIWIGGFEQLRRGSLYLGGLRELKRQQAIY